MFARVRRGTEGLEIGTVLEGFEGFEPGLRLRVGAVLDKWAATYPRLAGAILDVEQVPFVQLVRPDSDGRWPEDAGVDGSLLSDQPLFDRDPAWLVPVVHTDQADVFSDHAAGDERVAMPVFEGSQPEGRLEVLTAARLDDDRVVIGQVPWLADYVAYGDIVAVRPSQPADRVSGVPLVGAAVLHQGGYETLRFELLGRDHATGQRLTRELDGLSADPTRARVSTTTGTVHLNTRAPEEARRALRPFVRDGFLAEAQPRSEPPRTGPVAAHPDGGAHGEADAF